MHSKGDKPIIFVVVLKLEHIANCLILHDILNIDGNFGYGGFGDYPDFRALDSGKHQFSINFLILCSSEKYVLMSIVILVGFSDGLDKCDPGDALYNLKALYLKFDHAVVLL